MKIRRCAFFAFTYLAIFLFHLAFSFCKRLAAKEVAELVEVLIPIPYSACVLWYLREWLSGEKPPARETPSMPSQPAKALDGAAIRAGRPEHDGHADG